MKIELVFFVKIFLTIEYKNNGSNYKRIFFLLKSNFFFTG